jgi:hypothetical protein
MYGTNNQITIFLRFLIITRLSKIIYQTTVKKKGSYPAPTYSPIYLDLVLNAGACLARRSISFCLSFSAWRRSASSR